MTLAAPCVRGGEPPIEVNPNRPSFATPARTTQEGVAELEFGLQRTTHRDGGSLFFTPTLLKLGLLSDFELRLGSNGFERIHDPHAAPSTGLGDTTVGVQWCYSRGRPWGLDLAVQATWTLPTASAAKDLGSGEPDGLLMLLVSRDLGPYHVDVNGLVTWVGIPPAAGGGADREAAGTVCVSRTLGPHWSLTGELYSLGRTRESPNIVSTLWALGYKVSPRLVLDGGVDVGLSHGAQKISIFTGLTYGIGRFRHAGGR